MKEVHLVSATQDLSFSQLRQYRERAESQFMRADVLISCFVIAFGILAAVDVLIFAFVAQERLLVSGALLSGLISLCTWVIGGQWVDRLEARMLGFEAAIDAKPEI